MNETAAWWNDNWQYRIRVPVTNNTTEESNVYISFDGTTTYINTSDTAKFQSDCGDLRFTKENGELLPYYIVSGCGTSSTEVHVNFDTFPAGDQNIYYYYGNSTATNGTEASDFSTEASNYTIGTFATEETGPGPVAYWKFDEGVDNSCPEGGDACDSISGLEATLDSGDGTATVDTGDGHDGSKTVSGTDNSSFTYIALNATSGSGQTNEDRIEVGSTTGVTSGDDVLVIQMTGTGQGNWETCDVESIQTNDYIDCAANLSNTYQSSGAQVVVMPQWTNVTINDGGTLTTSAWNGTTGGIVAFRATGTVTVAADSGSGGGVINVSGLGFDGGTAGTAGGGGSGGSTMSNGSTGSSGGTGGNGTGPGAGNGGSNGGSPGGGGTDAFTTGGGGGAGGTGGGGAGGSYATSASSGSSGGSAAGGAGGGQSNGGAGGTGSGGSAGSSYGSTGLSSIYLGSGGGAGAGGAGGGGGRGGPFQGGGSGGDGGAGGTGGAGGGILSIFTDTITVSGSITADGTAGSNGSNGANGTTVTIAGAGGGGSPGAGGGGGSGGSIYIEGSTVTLGSSLVTSNGGSAGSGGTSGGDGGGTGGGGSGGSGGTGAGGGGEAADGTSGSGGGNATAGAGSAGADGRIHIDYTSISGTTSPTADTTEVSGSSGTGTDMWTNEELCISGKCIYVDGTDDTATVTNSDEIDFDTGLSGGFSFSTWIRVNSDGENNQGEIFDKGTNTYLRIDSEGSDGYADLEFNLDLATTDANVNVVNGIILNKWHHVAVTHDGTSTIDVYIDGVNQGTDTGSGVLSSDSNDLLLGGDSSNNFHGYIDEVKVYPYERSADQIKADYTARGSSQGVAAQFGPDNSWLSDGLVGYWKMEDDVSGDAQTISDSSGNGNDGTTDYGANTTGMDCTLAGKYGLGCDVDGTDDDIELGDIHDALDESLTVVAWFNTDVTSTKQGIVVKNQRFDNQQGYGLFIDSDDTVYVSTNFDGNDEKALQQSTATISSGEWHQIAMVIDRENNQVLGYLDGSNDGWVNGANGNDITGYSSMDTAIELVFGAGEQGTWELDGTIDEVRIYNRALSPAEVQDLYQWAPGPIGYWDFNENTGTTTAYDRSGNGHNGSLSGISKGDWTPGKFGSSINFDSSGDNVDIYSSSFNSTFSADSGSLMAWIKVPSSSTWTDNQTHYVAALRDDTDNIISIYKSSGNEFVTDYEAGATTDSYVHSISTTDWAHVAMTWDTSADEVKHFLNGQLMETDTGLGATTNFDTLDSGRTVIGNHRSDSPALNWLGSIDEVKVYNYARTPSQIIEDMNGGHPIGGSPVGSQLHYFKLDEGYGDTLNDSMGNGNMDLGGASGSCPGDADCPTWLLNSKVRGGLEFDGGDYATMTPPSNMDTTGDSQGTVTFWMRPDWDSSTTTTSRTIYVSGDGTDNISFGFCGNDVYCASSGFGNPGDFGITTNDGGSLQSAGGLDSSDYSWSAGDWVHVAMTWDDTDSTDNNMKVYLNGSLPPQTRANSSSFDMSAINQTGAIFGALNTSIQAPFDGVIDEFKIYSTSLTQEQILIDMNAGSSSALGGVLGTREQDTLTDGTMTDPVGYWDFNENTGTSTVYDKSGNGNDGTMSGSMTEDDWVPGKYSSALEFDGTDDKVNFGDISFGSIGDFTISAWIYADSFAADEGTILSKWESGNFSAWMFRTGTDGSLMFYKHGTCAGGVSGSLCESRTAASTLNTNTWYHVVAVYDDTSMQTNFYINGVFVENSQYDETYDSDPDGSTFDVTTGRRADDNDELDGKVDELKIFDYALSPAQIAWEYNRGKPVAWWRFDECEGNTAYDASGNGNNLTIDEDDTGGTNVALGTCGSGNGDEMWDNGTNGKFNGSLDFDGTDDYSQNTASNMPTLDGPMTITAWIYPRSAGSGSLGRIFHKSNDSSGNPSFLMADGAYGDNAIRLEYDFDGVSGNANGNWNSSDNAITYNEWQFVAVTYDASSDANDPTFYVNGQNAGLSEESTPIGNPEGDSAHIYVGNRSDLSREFDGQIDDLRVYNYILSESQIRNVMNGGAVRFD